MERAFSTRLIVTLVLVAIGIALASCGGPDAGSNAAADAADATASVDAPANAAGGEKLVSVKAEYSFCYSTGAYDPTQDRECMDNITYRECTQAEKDRAGSSSTFFYAVFSGGESRHAGWNANRYYMVVEYDNGTKTLETDAQTVFKDLPDDFMAYDLDGCYPAATITIFDEATDDPMGSMSFDYAVD